jgi:transposase
LTTKIHAAVNENGRLQKVQLTPGQQNDVTQAHTLLENQHSEKVVADKAYDSDEVRKTIRRLGARPVIPSRKGIRKRRYDKEDYKQRNVIERLFNRMKHFRRVATRYDKTDESFLGFIFAAALFIVII